MRPAKQCQRAQVPRNAVPISSKLMFPLVLLLRHGPQGEVVLEAMSWKQMEPAQPPSVLQQLLLQRAQEMRMRSAVPIRSNVVLPLALLLCHGPQGDVARPHPALQQLLILRARETRSDAPILSKRVLPPVLLLRHGPQGGVVQPHPALQRLLLLRTQVMGKAVPSCWIMMLQV